MEEAKATDLGWMPRLSEAEVLNPSLYLFCFGLMIAHFSMKKLCKNSVDNLLLEFYNKGTLTVWKIQKL